MNQFTSRPRLALALIGCALHVAPLALALADPARAFTAGDSRDWDRLARNLLEHGVYSRSPAPPFEPEIFRAPAYPFFVAAVYGLTGGGLPALLVVQALLAALAGVLVYTLGARLGLDPRAAGLGALIGSLLPVSSIFWATLASENLFAVCLLLALVLAWRAGPRRPPPGAAGLSGLASAALAGLAAGAMLLSRPIGVLLLPALALGLVWPVVARLPKPAGHAGRSVGNGARADFSLRRPPAPLTSETPMVAAPAGQAWLSLPRLLVAALAGCLVLAPWWWRSQQLFGRPAISTVGGVNLLTYNAAAVLARRQGLGFWEGRYLMWEYWDAYYAGLDPKPANPVEDADAMRRAAMQVILASPLEFAWVNTLESLNSLRPGVAQLTVFLQPGAFDQASGSDGDISPAAGLLSQPLTRALTLTLTGLYGVVYLLTAAGALAALRGRNWPLLLATALPAAILLLTPGPVANSRFRVPAEPLMGLLVAQGLGWVGGVVRSWRRGRYS